MRTLRAETARFRVGPLLVDLAAYQVGSEQLSEQEVALLRVLHDARGHTVDKESLYREVWGYRTMPRGRALDFAVRRLRKKLGPDGEQALETVRGVGFRLRTEPVEAPGIQDAGPEGPSSGGLAALRKLRPTTSFVGAPDVVAELSAHLEGGARCITLLGPAGIGKTRLAVEALSSLGGKVWVAELCDLPVSADPLQRLGAVLSAPSAGLSIDGLARAAVRAGRGVLLVDRCAHVADGLRPALEAVLRMSELVVVATSRHRLGVEGETLFDVGPLPPHDAARLLVDRARAVRRGLRLCEDDLTTARIVSHLGGVPLAIELAASRLRATSPRQLERRLREDLRGLDASGHRPLGEAIRWSWDLLSAEHQAAVVCLSLLDVRFDEAAAIAVLQADSKGAWSALEDLVDRSWLQPVDDDNGLQYVFLAPMRAWVREHGPAAPRSAYDGLVDHCLRRARAAARMGLQGAGGLDQLRCATRFAVAEGHPEAALLASYAMRVARRSLTPVPLLAWARKLQASLTTPSGDLAVEMGWAVHQSGDSAGAQVIVDEAVGYTCWSVFGRMRARWLQARLLTDGGHTPLAAERVEVLRVDAEAAGQMVVAVGAASLLVELYIDLGRLGDALAAGRWALQIVESSDGGLDSSALGPSMLTRLAPLYLMEGDVALARTMLRDAAVAGERIQCRNIEGGALLNLAMLEAVVGEAEPARALLEQVIRAGFSDGRPMVQVQVELVRCLAAMAEDELGEARSFAVRAVRLSRTSGGQRMKGAALSFVLRLDVLSGHSHSSVADEVVTLCREGGLHLLGSMVVGYRAWLAARAGEPGADVLADEAVALADVGGRADELVSAFAGAAVGYAAEQRWDDADRSMARAHRLAHELAHLGGVVDLMERAKGEVEAMRAQA